MATIVAVKEYLRQIVVQTGSGGVHKKLVGKPGDREEQKHARQCDTCWSNHVPVVVLKPTPHL
jgi:hypothetical protein